jgi:hypothetical protein
MMKKPDLEKCAKAVNELQGLPPASAELSLLGTFAIITLVQAAVQQQPEIADDGWAKIGIAAARQLQEDLFKQYPETYETLEFCWSPEAYVITPSVIAAMLQDFAKNEIIKCDGGCDETVSQQISRNILKIQGFVDM